MELIVDSGDAGSSGFGATTGRRLGWWERGWLLGELVGWAERCYADGRLLKTTQDEAKTTTTGHGSRYRRSRSLFKWASVGI
ncbi:hypothetical protein G7Z17_g10133 [Cylindrodendrum hubeiense]|uniref:Uncharacterized protein n=1 Tax=Cylindrodendrum hubeiense TaxID=595255 RepID=A0A9P5LBI7_9HYPO|nr:hypothetical protein G7Z17_g10133 [Cylindrodendrum hubeiense]